MAVQATMGLIATALASVFCASPVSAMPPPTVVIGDTVTLGVNAKTVEFDTTHFGAPSLLVGTTKNGNGDCFVLRVRTSPLEVAETLCTFQSVPLLVRAGRLDADEYPDLLVSLNSYCPNDSPSYSSVVLRGPDFNQADTLCFRGYLRDVIIDDLSHEVWLTYGSFALRFTDIHSGDSLDTLVTSFGAFDLEHRDVNQDGEAETAAFWQWKSSNASAPHEPPPPAMAAFGVLVAQEEGSTLLSDTWLQVVQSGYYYGYAEPRVAAPVPVGDLTGAGYPQRVTSFWYVTTWPGPTIWGNNGVAVRSLVTGDSVWNRTLPPPPTYSPASVSLWDLDHDGVLDVLASQKVATVITYPPPTVNAVWGFKGSTGDSLFYFEFTYVLDPVIVGSLDNSGIRKGVLVRADTLFIFHLDFTTTGVDDDESITPADFELLPNYPNPFNAQTRIEYEVNRPTHVTLAIYDVLGRLVKTVVDESQTTGRHVVTWDGQNRDGEPVSSGVYFYRMKTADGEQVRKMLLLK